MKHFCALFIGVMTLFQMTSCSSEAEQKKTQAAEKALRDPAQKEEWFPETDFDTLRGLYTGDFGNGFINVVLTYVNDKKAIGYNIHKGLQRNISGEVIQKKEHFELTLNEPGDNEYDGKFTLLISKKDGSVNASWTANDPKIPSKKFKLKKQALKKNGDSKSVYEGGEITEHNFIDIFSYANFDAGNVEFRENGIIRYTYYPEGQENAQQEVIKGSWKFVNPKTMVIEWAKNSVFKEQQMKFLLTKDEYDVPTFEGINTALSIYPEYY